MMNTFPHELQCQESDIANFSHLFSAFFKTSFHIAEKNESTWYRDPYHYEVWNRKKLVSGTSSTRLTKGQKEKQAESARNLTLLALEELAIENDVDWSRSLLESFASRDDLQNAINLYSYAHELVRRSQFASQGAAVHSLWRSIDKKTRQSLNVDVLWAARETLVNAMQSNVGA